MSDIVEVVEAPERFERWLAGRPLAQRSRREYARNVRAYCDWLAVTPDREGWQGDPLAEYPDSAADLAKRQRPAPGVPTSLTVS